MSNRGPDRAIIAYVVYGNFHIRKCATPLYIIYIFHGGARTFVIGSGRGKRVIDRLNIYKDVRLSDTRK